MIVARLPVCLRLLALTVCALALGACSPAGKKARHLERARDYIAANQRASAEIELLNVLRLDPQDVPATRLLAQVYVDQGRLAQAMPLLVSARRLLPADPAVRLELGQGWLAANHPEEAFKEALVVLAASPDEPDAWLLLAETAVTPEQLATAREHLREPADGTALDATRHTALAVLEAREGNFPAALARLDTAIATEPALSAPHSARASILMAQGDQTAALDAFQRAAALSPARSARTIVAARFLQRGGAGDAARKLLDAAIATAPDYLPALTLRAEFALADKDPDACAALLEKIRAIDTGFSDAHVLEARLKLLRGEYASAEADLQKLVATFPQSAQLHHLLALAQLGGPNQSSATQSLTRSLSLAPDNTEAILLLATLNIRRDNAGAAVLALQALTQKQPKLEAAWALLAEAYQRQGNLRAALDTLAEAQQHFADRPQPLLRKATIQRLLGQTAEARETLNSALALQPGFSPAVEQLINFDLQDNATEAAAARAAAFAAAFPDQPEGHLLVARVAVARNDVTAAETALRTVIRLRPDFGQAYLMLARLLAQHDRADDALRELAEAAERDPRDQGVRMLTGMIRQQRGEIDAARTAYEAAVAIAPNFVQALNNLAYIYSEHDRQLDRAQELADRARRLAPQDPYVLDTLGWILFQKGQYTWARSLFVESTSRLADNPEVQAHLGLTHHMLGEIAPATVALKAFLASDPTGELADEARQCLVLLEIDPAAASPTLPDLVAARLRQRSDDPVAVLRLAAWHDAHGRSNDARDALRDGLKRQPKNVRLLVAQAQWLADHGSLAQAYELARKTYQDAPDDLAAAQTVGRLAFRSGDHESAANVLRECVRRSPTSAGLQRDLAEALVSVGALADARNALQAAIAAGLPGTETTSALRTIDLLSVVLAGKVGDTASADVLDAIAAAPDTLPALLAQAVVHERANEAAAAAATYETILGRFPACHVATLQLASLYLDQPDRRTRALELAQRVRASQPDNPQTARILGTLAYQGDDFERAIPLLTEAMLKLPGNAHVCWLLGNALEHQKRPAEARAAWQRALDRGLTGPEAETARRILAAAS